LRRVRRATCSASSASLLATDRDRPSDRGPRRGSARPRASGETQDIGLEIGERLRRHLRPPRAALVHEDACGRSAPAATPAISRSTRRPPGQSPSTGRRRGRHVDSRRADGDIDVRVGFALPCAREPKTSASLTSVRPGGLANHLNGGVRRAAAQPQSLSGQGSVLGSRLSRHHIAAMCFTSNQGLTRTRSGMSRWSREIGSIARAQVAKKSRTAMRDSLCKRELPAGNHRPRRARAPSPSNARRFAIRHQHPPRLLFERRDRLRPTSVSSGGAHLASRA
jgi:hypothetical protein